MKFLKLKIKFKFLPVLLLLNSCSGDFNNKCFDDIGNVTTEIRTFDNIYTIMVYGVYDLFIQKDTTNYAEIESSENLIPLIKTELRDAILYISDDINCKWSREYKRNKITLHLKDIHQIMVFESCNIRSVNTLQFWDFFINIRADLAESSVDIDCERFKFWGSYTTSGKNIITGTTKFLEIQAYNALQVDAEDLQSKTSKIVQKSIGDMYIWIDEVVNVEMLSSGNLFIKGRPDSINIINYTGTGKILPL